MNLTKLPIGTIFTVANDERRLMIVGYSKTQSDTYIVCVCDENEAYVNKLYSINVSQINIVLSLGYVDVLRNNNIINANNTTNNNGGKYQFDANGFVISDGSI